MKLILLDFISTFVPIVKYIVYNLFTMIVENLDIPLTLDPLRSKRDSRNISDISRRRPRFTKMT
jgi:hypothetical protein